MSRRRQAEIELYGKIMFLEIADQNENEYLETSFSSVKIIIRIVIELARDKFWILSHWLQRFLITLAKSYFNTCLGNGLSSKMLAHAVEKRQPGTYTQNWSLLKSTK